MKYETIHEAAAKGDLADVKRHLKNGVSVESMDKQHQTPLMTAALMDQLDVVKFLVEDESADVNARDNDGYTPLTWASTKTNDRLDMAQYLVDNGADVDTRNKNGVTPLMMAMVWAMFTYKLDIAKFLIAHGADVDTRDNYGVTPLMMAVGMGKLYMVKFLVENGANVNARNVDGHTPLMLVTGKGHPDVVEFLKQHGAK